MEDKIILSCPVSRATIDRIIEDSIYFKTRPSDRLTIGVIKKITDYDEVRAGVRSHALVKNGVFNFLPAVYYTIGQRITFKPLFSPVIPIDQRDRLINQLLNDSAKDQNHVNYLELAKRLEVEENVNMRNPDYSLILDGIAIKITGTGDTPSQITGRVPSWLSNELDVIVPMDVWTNVGRKS